MKKTALLMAVLMVGVSFMFSSCARQQPQKQADPPIIIDTDPGTDDSSALMIAAAKLGDRVKLLVSTYGNSPLATTTQNLADLADLFGLDAPIVQGAATPAKEAKDPQLSEGENGIAAANLPRSSREVIGTDPSDAILKVLKENPGADYVVLGPMTNLANLLQKHPDAAEYIGRVVTMAGGIDTYNMNDCAEFNIFCDPVSAAYVLSSSLPVHMVPLDTTNQLILTHDELLQIAAGSTEKLQYIQKILLENERVSLSYGFTGAVIYDASALAYLVDPSIFTTVKTGISVSTADADYGKTVKTTDRSNVTLTGKADIAKVYKMLCDAAKTTAG